MNNISINDISFSYNNGNKNITVFDHYSATFPAEKLSVIMSPSGSGKTTLLYLIAGLLQIDNGHIIYHLDNPRFSFVFQDIRLIDHVTVAANLKLVNPNLSSDDIDTCLSNLQLEGFATKKVKHLSGGEKQRVAIARALLVPYDILLMDEPFTGLDDDAKNIVMTYIKKRTAGKTVLLVTHDKDEANSMGGAVINI